MMSRRLFPLLALLVVLAAGCRDRSEHSQRAVIPPYTPPATPATGLVSAQERFACKLLQTLHREQPDRNLLFSPLSLNLALGMLANGAKGETLTAIQRTLEWQALPLAQMNRDSQALVRGLRLGKREPDITLANSVWVDPQWPLRPQFQKTVASAYDAAVQSLGFGNPQTAAAEINRWASAQTRQMIPQIVTPQDLDQVAVVLANALYFEGKWTEPFADWLTHDGPFHLPNGRQKDVPLMDQSGKFRYLEQPEFQAVSLPYGSGRLSFYVFLPAEKVGLGGFLPRVTADNWAQWQQGFAEREGEVKLPRFRADYANHLKKTLTALGMGVAFDPQRADLSGMAAPGLWVGDVIHKAIVEVGEKGTKAAAVSLAAVPGCAAPAPLGSPFTMIVDRPFLCAIRDNGTGALLFLGVVVDPEELRQ